MRQGKKRPFRQLHFVWCTSGNNYGCEAAPEQAEWKDPDTQDKKESYKDCSAFQTSQEVLKLLSCLIQKLELLALRLLKLQQEKEWSKLLFAALAESNDLRQIDVSFHEIMKHTHKKPWIY